MKCPFCDSEDLKVLESRAARDGDAIRRRRECASCRRRFTTFEEIERPRLLIVKKDGTREEFNREKVLNGLIISSEKRPITLEQLRDAVDHMERDLFELGVDEVESREIGERAMAALWRLDKVAFIRFASVYARFDDPTEFVRLVEEVHGLQSLTEAPAPTLRRLSDREGGPQFQLEWEDSILPSTNS
ncbi:MAG: transcriptional regulator NrdR [Fimbriimonadaceae bacterium]|nr:transcriptional regulator NrdR [Fimbriimonadaceae bacterium]